MQQEKLIQRSLKFVPELACVIQDLQLQICAVKVLLLRENVSPSGSSLIMGPNSGVELQPITLSDLSSVLIANYQSK